METIGFEEAALERSELDWDGIDEICTESIFFDLLISSENNLCTFVISSMRLRLGSAAYDKRFLSA